MPDSEHWGGTKFGVEITGRNTKTRTKKPKEGEGSKSQPPGPQHLGDSFSGTVWTLPNYGCFDQGGSQGPEARVSPARTAKVTRHKKQRNSGKEREGNAGRPDANLVLVGEKNAQQGGRKGTFQGKAPLAGGG